MNYMEMPAIIKERKMFFIWINMKSISVTKSSGEVIVLNDTPFRFDLLSLRGTAVLLVGNDMVPAGTYNHFTINLNDGNSIELEYESKPLLITNEYTKTFNVPGPFDLRGGRMTEIILDFDPNLSVFNTLDSGYVMEPTIKVVSILSMTPEQDIRVQQALGEYANAVIKEADVIFQGSVNSLNYIVANNIYGSSPYRVGDFRSISGSLLVKIFNLRYSSSRIP
jgi:hypothetical protein